MVRGGFQAESRGSGLYTLRQQGLYYIIKVQVAHHPPRDRSAFQMQQRHKVRLYRPSNPAAAATARLL